MNDLQRLSKVMSQRGLCSRREADRLIAAGQVYVDGERVDVLGTKIAPDADIRLGNAGEAWMAQWASVIMNKPVGIVSTQPEGDQRPAWQLLTREGFFGDAAGIDFEQLLRKPWTFSVAGRLDRDSRGLLLLTQEGRIGRAITEGHRIDKEYEVRCAGPVSDAQIEAMRGHEQLDGKRLRRMRIERMGKQRLRFVLREGRKHQVRRVCQDQGLIVDDLFRVRVGPCVLGDLPEGCWRLLSDDERDAVLL